ncbi:alpha-amylase family glycosyl hydrolase [Altericroceibacterium xinjiangense]|uniref:alpha-amylase family glycosyl hydrolase n=1 Tax=Altericroceibacterium xinjiangense TaxID=762261 RepID=UPI000F7D5E9C|nr:alpha-amylase family glycosyl hydrolase [Altericroceibacterium xinjiangense]
MNFRAAGPFVLFRKEDGVTHWWQDATIYQIYPRSYQDTDEDGVGDLAGIRQRLPYLRDLGVDAVWLSPIFQSPMADFGYDVADYRAIDPLFGTMADFDALLADTHAAGLKLLLDFVPNHTSDQHAWFQESRSSRDNPKRDWYIWCDPAPDGGPPNNWMSNFGGSGWTFDDATGQYYYHAFLKEQPDLNWRNPQVRKAMADVLRFWLDKGVDGFRVDVIWHLAKDPQFRDNPPNPAWKPGQRDLDRYLQRYSADQPHIHDIIAELRDVIDSYPERLLIGEIYLPVDRLMAYYGEDGEGVHLPFNFQLINAPWRTEVIGPLIDEYEAALPEGGWPNWVLSNHDQPRIADRVSEEQARIAAMLLLTLRGTPTLYYGDEIGIAKAHIPADRIQDPWAKNEPEASFNRDRARTPMQWSAGPHGGFSTVEPWLPLTNDLATCNVDTEQDDPCSMLALHRELLGLRKREEELRQGAYTRMDSAAPVLAYRRGENLAVLLNLSAESAPLDLPDRFARGEVLLRASTGANGGPVPDQLPGNEGLVVRAADG